jgi:hypothetical protein
MPMELQRGYRSLCGPSNGEVVKMELTEEEVFRECLSFPRPSFFLTPSFDTARA